MERLVERRLTAQNALQRFAEVLKEKNNHYNWSLANFSVLVSCWFYRGTSQLF